MCDSSWGDPKRLKKDVNICKNELTWCSACVLMRCNHFSSQVDLVLGWNPLSTFVMEWWQGRWLPLLHNLLMSSRPPCSCTPRNTGTLSRSWSTYIRYTQCVTCEDVCLVEFMHLVFTCMPGESHHRWFRPLLWSSDAFHSLLIVSVKWYKLFTSVRYPGSVVCVW